MCFCPPVIHPFCRSAHAMGERSGRFDITGIEAGKCILQGTIQVKHGLERRGVRHRRGYPA